MTSDRLPKSKWRLSDRRLHVESLEERRMLAVFVVSNLTDAPVVAAGSLPGSLRQAVFDANSAAGADRIDFQGGLTGTITLSAGQLDVTESLELNGPGSHLLAISGSSSSRILNISDGNANVDQLVTVRGLTLTDGDTTNAGFVDQGGAVRSVESFVLEDSVVINNYSEDDGGGLWVDPDADDSAVIIRNSLITGNRSRNAGGGAFVGNNPTVSVVIEGSTFSYNHGATGITSGGGGLHFFANGPAIIRETTFSGNISDFGDGGGINIRAFASVDLLLTAVTVSGNQAVRGAGLNIFGPTTGEGVITIEHSTITGNKTTGNSVGNGGGIYMFFTNVALNHSIVAGNEASRGPDLYARSPITFAATHNLLGDRTESGLNEAPLGSPDADGNLIGDPDGSGVIDARLAPLADAGGPTKVHALLADSPALDAGDAAIASPPAFDQRGAPFVRIVDGDSTGGGRIDIGAYEWQDLAVAPTLIVDSAIDRVDGDYSAGNLSLREAVGLANADLHSLQTITFDAVLDGRTLLQPHGTLTFTDDATILGLGRDALTIAGVGHSAVFQFDDGDEAVQRNMTMEDLAVTGGRSQEIGVSETLAGGLNSLEQTTLHRLSIHHNETTDGTGGLLTLAEGVDNLLTDSLITNNVGTQIGGAGIVAQNGGSTTVRNTIFRENSATFGNGGAVVLAQSGSSALVTESLFENNISAGVGGGLLGMAVGGEFVLENSRLSGNTADAAAGVYFLSRYDGTLIARNLEVLDNDSTTTFPSFFRGGGGIQIATGPTSTALLENSLIARNSTTGPGGGINVLSNQGQTTLHQITVTNNNSAGNGGGIHDLGFNGGATSILHSTVTANHAASPTSTSVVGGGVFSLGGPLTLDHTIVAGNTDEAGSADAHADPIGFQGNPGVLEADFSLIGNNTGSGLAQAPVGAPDARGNLIGGPGGAALDAQLGPLASNGGFSQTHALLASSPAIGTGDPNFAFTAGKFDQRGLPYSRVHAGRIDIGALEQQPQPADFDGDDDVDGADFLAWQRGFPAIYSDNNLADWEATYGQGITTTAAVSSDLAVESQADTQGVAAPRRRLIDAAMAREWLDVSIGEKKATTEGNPTTEALFLSVSDMQKQSPTSTALAEFDTPVGLSTEVTAQGSRSDEPWLSEELLERVFGRSRLN